MRLLPKREAIGDPGCTIMFRWELVNFGPRVGKLMLHHFLPDRDDLYPHDHPSAFWTLVLRGSYKDMVVCDRCRGVGDELAKWRYKSPCWGCEGSGLMVGDYMRAGMLRRREAEHMHVTKIGPQGAWTLCWMGPKVRDWGFRLGNGHWMPWRDFVGAFGFGERC